ncbi:MAG: UTP--glucose-1-phosphate uridylyltransferase [Verrucomicrobia bacterium]|nr:MAG: UTP--glucose-1-phosphate uridylyltransferase [Verrucomicrobiota bacterium]
MNISKAVVTAAGKNQRTLPLQTLVDRDGVQKSALSILAEEISSAGIDQIAVVISPGDRASYEQAAGEHGRKMQFIEQTEPLGYGHAVHCAASFTGDDPFLLMVGDHLYLSTTDQSCAAQLIATATAENCSVSAVQATHESKLRNYGAVGGHRLAGSENLYQIESVREKPSPTEAEQSLVVPGLRAGNYLCFFGLHVLTPSVMEILAKQLSHGRADLSAALALLSRSERYLAHELHGRRHDIGLQYGLLTAQLALGLAGKDRDEVLTHIIELLAQSHA